jgi:hypothetical protein
VVGVVQAVVILMVLAAERWWQRAPRASAA